ncbi:tetratricopeptide repeat protein [Desulfopila inferna]|uniref:tetratricopeptide repeat protein n=1 Tax=Desulfopila inferna TaxID=468528 RepID=UPI001962C78B|nr:hypothetical protein [Desulfopila inferna]MBM9604346.1 hypothetical protein [Desulfopila inferna]
MVQNNKSSQQLCRESNSSCPPKEIRKHLSCILSSPDFDASQQQRDFLTFVVDQKLAGNSQAIKAYTVATEVFGRNDNFSQADDPIVSIQANKLRRALERYYLLSGRNDELRISIPKGAYVPIFSRAQEYVSEVMHKERIMPQGPTVLIKPFINQTNHSRNYHLGESFTTELSTEICRYQWIKVLRPRPAFLGISGMKSFVRFFVEGSIREDDKGIKVNVSLFDAKSDRLIWCDFLRMSVEEAGIIEFQEKFAAKVGTVIAGENGIIARTLYAESKNTHFSRLGTYEAILQYHAYEQTFSPEDFTRALQALKRACCIEPGCGQAWSFLARLYAAAFSLELPGFDIYMTEKKALEYALRGAQLQPQSQANRVTLAYIRMLAGDIDLARRDIELAYAMNPESPFMMDVIGYIMTLLGQWEKGSVLIKNVMRLNPYYRPMVHYALWAVCLRRGDCEGAYIETTEIRRNVCFWHPLAKAATLGLCGRIEEGRTHAEELLRIKPDFPERCNILLQRYIKFDEITECLVTGLERVGIKIH